MPTWKRVITTNDNSNYKNSEVSVSDLGGGSGTTEFLRKDGNWAVPPDTDTNTPTTADLLTALNANFDGDITIGNQTDDDVIFTGPIQTKQLKVMGGSGGPAKLTLQADSPDPENGDKWEIWGSDLNSGQLNFYNNTSGSDTLVFQIAGDGDVTVKKDLQIDGDLTVSGATTTVNTETINLADNTIKLNSNHSGSPTQDGGITIERGSSDDQSFFWDESNDAWAIGHTESSNTFTKTGFVCMANAQTYDDSQDNVNGFGEVGSMQIDGSNIYIRTA